MAQLTTRSYTSLTISGTYDTVGVTLTDATIIGNITLALRASSSYGPVSSNGHSWAVGACGAGSELSAGGSVCACRTPSYALRACIGNSNWGGVNSTTCSAPTQTMTATFEYV